VFLLRYTEVTLGEIQQTLSGDVRGEVFHVQSLAMKKARPLARAGPLLEVRPRLLANGDCPHYFVSSANTESAA
jgi:hypothetical protein